MVGIFLWKELVVVVVGINARIETEPHSCFPHELANANLIRVFRATYIYLDYLLT